jgi:DNA repair protein REV1
LADLPGFGRQADEKLRKSTNLRVTDTCETLLKISPATLKSALGAQKAEKLLDAARGVDKTPWCVRPARKSIGAQMSWGVRCASDEIAMDYVKQLVNEVAQRMQRLKIRGRVLNLKLWRSIPDVTAMRDYQGHGACDVLTRTKTMRELSNDTELITNEASLILREFNVEATLIRGLGVSITKLEHGAATTSSPGTRQPTLSQMFTKSTKPSHEEETITLAASDEELAETESEGEEDIANTQSQLTQNDCDFTLFNSQAEIDSDREKSIRDAYEAAARAYAWQRFELGRLKLSKRRRDTLSEDEYARRACARVADVIATQARRSYARDGETGLTTLLDDARALCRSQELLHETYSSQGAAFIAAWLDRVDAVGKTIAVGSNRLKTL